MVEEGEEVTGPALKAGLLVGDEILAVDGGYVENFMDIQNRIVTGKQQTAQGRRLVNLIVLRDGKEIKIKVYPEVVGREEIRVIGIGPQETFFIESLEPDMPAIKAGLEVIDQPIRIDNQKIHSFSQLVAYLNQSDINQTISFCVLKRRENGQEKTYQLSPIEKEIVLRSNSTLVRKLIGFRPGKNCLLLTQTHSH